MLDYGNIEVNILTKGEDILGEYVFGAIGEKEVVFNGESLTIINKTVVDINDIKCAYIKYPTALQNGTVYFSQDGNDVNVTDSNNYSFIFTKYQQEDVENLLSELGIEVLESVGSLQSEPQEDQSVNDPEKKGFWEKVSEQAKESKRLMQQERQYKKERIKQMDREGIAYCPKCKSTSLTANKKGFGAGKAAIGAMIFLPLVAAGNIGAKKVRVTCLKCGHQFWAGKK